MRRLFLFFLLLALPAGAADICVDTTTCYTTVAAENAAVAEAKTNYNAGMCATVSLPSTCTQAEFTAAGGVGVIYAANGTGTRLYFIDAVIKPALAKFVAESSAMYRERAKNAWNAASSAQQQAACIALGLSATCQ